MLLILFIYNGLYGAILIVEQALHLQGTQMGYIVRGHAVMIQQIPLALEFYNRVVGCPTYYRLQNNALIGEGAVRIVACGVAEQMTVTC